MKKCILLGYANGTSKSSGKPYYRVSVAIPFDNGYGTGYYGKEFFIDEVTYAEAIKHKPLETVECDIRFANGYQFLISIA